MTRNTKVICDRCDTKIDFESWKKNYEWHGFYLPKKKGQLDNGPHYDLCPACVKKYKTLLKEFLKEVN